MKKRRFISLIIGIIMVISGCLGYLQYGRDMDVYGSYAMTADNYHEERLTVVVNKLYVADQKVCAEEIVKRCRENSFKSVRFSYDQSIPNKAMRFLRENDVTAEMYNKNIPSTYRKKTMRSIMSSLSLQWATGKALCEILNNSRYEGDDGADNIDSTIELLQNTISYNLPLLLKPLYDMKQSESPFLKCMQVGAFGVVERCMIEMGVPRESALYLYKEIFDEKEIKVENRLELEQIIREKIRLEYKNIPYWIQVQLDFLI